jgi:hypothetical protein
MERGGIEPCRLAWRDGALSASSGLNWTRFADVAQLVEHQLPKLRVAGSIPVVRFGTNKPKPAPQGGFRLL